jgi:hypothetical protein
LNCILEVLANTTKDLIQFPILETGLSRANERPDTRFDVYTGKNQKLDVAKCDFKKRQKLLWYMVFIIPWS